MDGQTKHVFLNSLMSPIQWTNQFKQTSETTFLLKINKKPSDFFNMSKLVTDKIWHLIIHHT